MDLATLLEGPANVTHRGQTFHFKGGLTVTPLADLFTIDSDVYGPLGQRALENSVVISGTPVGVWTDAQLAVLFRWNDPIIGSLVTPRYDVSAIDTSTDIVTLIGSLVPRDGAPIRMSAFPGATLPAAITGTTTYFWGNSGKVYDTEAHAITDDGTGKIDFADDGTGDLAIIEQEYIQVDALSANRRITFWNGAITGMPPVVHSTVATLLGQVTFGCFRKNNAAWSDADSLYTVAKVALSDSAPDPDDIPTQEYALSFGASPWDDFKARGAVTVTPALATDPVATDADGNLGLKISGLTVGATFAPAGFSEAQMLDLLGLQGGTVRRGGDRVRDDLIVTGTGVYTAVYNGAPRQLPQTFSTTGPRAGELEVVGAAATGSPRFFVGTAAP